MLYHQPLNEHRAGRETSSRRSARPAMERTGSLRKTHEGEGVIQAKTMIHYSPGRYDYDFDPCQGKFRKSVTVGRVMHAELDPGDERNGSSTSRGGDVHKDLMRYLNRKWGTISFRGHLLNDHLGGLSVEENLFPISHAANTEHLNQFERYVKHYVYDRSKDGPGLVQYDVTVNNEGGSQQFDEFHPRTEFNCHLAVYGREEANSAREDRDTLLETSYTVGSDISNGSAGDGKSEFFSDAGSCFSNNIRGRWSPGNTNLESRGDTVIGGGYELRRKTSRGSSGKQDSLGTVMYESGSYIGSAEWNADAYKDRKMEWGHEAAALYWDLGPELGAAMDEILNTGSGGMYQKAEIKVREAVKKRGLTVSPAAMGGICSLFILDLQKAESDIIGAKADSMFIQFQKPMIDIILGCDANEKQSKEALLQAWGKGQDAFAERYLEVFYRNGMKAITDGTEKELRTVIIPYIWEQKDGDWMAEIREIVFPKKGEGDRKEISDVMRIVLFQEFSEGALGEYCPIIGMILEKGEQSFLYQNILCAKINESLDMAISKMRQVSLAKLKTIGLEDSVNVAIWDLIAQNVPVSEIVKTLGENIQIPTEMEETVFSEAYGSLADEMRKEGGTLDGHEDVSDVRAEFFENVAVEKHRMIYDILTRIFDHYLTPVFKGKFLAYFGQDLFRADAGAEMIMNNCAMDNGYKMAGLPGCTQEDVQGYVDTTPAEYDWLDFSRQYDTPQTRKDYERQYLTRILWEQEYKRSYLSEIIKRVVYRWIFESELEGEESEEDDPAYEEEEIL